MTATIKRQMSQRWKNRRSPSPPSAAPVRTLVDQARIKKWIFDRLLDWRDSCWHCRKPIVPGQLWTAVSNGEAVVRFHQPCHAEWLAEQEVAARRALGLDRSERP
jgi:hypothetical protein